MINFTNGPNIGASPSVLLVGQLRQQLKIIGTSQDAVLEGWLDLAVDLIGKYTWRLLTEKEVTAEFSCCTDSRIVQGVQMLDFRRAPFNELLSVKFRSTTGDEILLAHHSICGEFAEVFIDSEPANSDSEAEYPLVVFANCGYKVDDGKWLCPTPIQQAVIALASYMYSNPTECGASGCNCAGGRSSSVSLPYHVSALLAPFVIRRYDAHLFV